MAAPSVPLPDGCTLRHAETDSDLRACFRVMHQLRPQLAGEGDFLARLQRMRADRYRLLAAWNRDTVLSLAGYRLQENLVYGRFLYVDDLVTDTQARGSRWGARLLESLTAVAVEAGCACLVLDTALSNAQAQRFYFREGLLTGALRFKKPLGAGK
ncbi:MAG TPA: GNAT family N-acetyltransferase [Burkholderiaceae bacterium]|jgi:ribosomal protein S18 acetylase RimI-like enzyme